MKTLFSRVTVSGRQIFKLSALILLSAVGEMLLPSLLARMINRGVNSAAPQTVLALALIMAAITVFACVVNLFSVKIASRISTDFAARLRKEVFEQVQGFSCAELDRFGTASLVTRSTSDITNVQNFLAMLLRIGILAPMMAAAGLVFSAATGGRVSSVLTIAIPVLLLALGAIVAAASRYSVLLREKLDGINRLFLESLEGVRVIRAFNKQKTEMQRFDRLNGSYADTSMAAGRIGSLLMPAINVIFGVTTAAVLGLGSVSVESGAMEVGSLVANSQYISMVLMSVMMLALVIMMLPTAYACAKRVAEVLETDSSVKDGSFPFENRPLRSTVEFRHVTFAYPGADEFIEKKSENYHDPVSQGGANLSGGQRQRMAIARALMKQPEIYVFDDSFSALDMKTDQLLRKRLKENIGNATVIMVAQRISTILDADRILVIDDGRIIGQGTHVELIKNCPVYREIAELQLGKENLS